MENSKRILFKGVNLKVDFNAKEEIINVWVIVAGGGLVLITNLMTPHLSELKKETNEIPNY